MASGERLEGRIVSVRGGVRRGSPIAGGTQLELSDGRVMEVRHEPSADEQQVEVKVHWACTRVDFDVCPICLTSNPTSKEHVPQGEIGGSVMTLTCTKCNNFFGGKVEPELAAWSLDAQVNARASGPAEPGLRRLPPIYIRGTQNGEFVLFVAGRADPAILGMLRAGELTLNFRPPRMTLVRLAALKHAYLAACLTLGTIPQGEAADHIRAELVGVRDADDSTAAAEACQIAAALKVARSHQDPGPHSVMIGTSAGNPDEWWVMLAGVVAVSWPLRTDLLEHLPQIQANPEG